ncbi:MAG TPA: patatin-like phospholipase family protein [Terriglobales bacterium]|nr:patatin-like phospholipase family protein [Terriglobales bacterium]
MTYNSGQMPQTPITAPVGVDEVLAAERRALRAPGDNTPLAALCLSGGGIRSATFGLGVLQGLAEHELLTGFDYLSTVSGGGYIGGWLTAWMRRAGGLAPVVDALRPDAAAPAPGTPDPIEHLREYNNYLTPRLGALSADTWTLAFTYLRNVFLNWLVFVPLLVLALMGPRLILAFAVRLKQVPALAITALPLPAVGLLTMCMWNTLRYLPGVGGVNHRTRDFVVYVLMPLVLSVGLFTSFESVNLLPLPMAMIGALLPCGLAWAGYRITMPRTLRRERHNRQVMRALAGAALPLGLGLGAAAYWMQSRVVGDNWPVFVTAGPPMVLLGFCLAGAVFVGLSSHALGTEDREWLARAGAYIMMVGVIWWVACALVLLAPDWILPHPWQQWGLSLLAGASAWASSQLGFKAPATARAADKPAQKSGSARTRDWLLKLAPTVFLVLLGLGLVILTNWLLTETGTAPAPWNDGRAVVTGTRWTGVVGFSLAFWALAWFMARFININKFSLQGMYRDRLIRAYLGASNPKRNANLFTGFSTSDDCALACLDPAMRPLHVVNLTLNLVAEERLAWQQRKAESFTATALHCGSAQVGYRPAAEYGGEGGMTLGTAVAISGAAASPNMGYHSSPLVGFIMTLFNVRLGAWLGNPGTAGAKTWTHAGPRSATRALLREALGQTTDQSDFVYLSDGGHFENLGLYEMIRRRCRRIMVMDAGCDADFTYEDLGNALRKIRIDLRVPIRFSDESQAALRARSQRWATATIQYSLLDPSLADGELIYLKPMLLGTEPPDVLSYAASHPTFPHQGTDDQWFDESQTESYRMLGIRTVAELCRQWQGWEKAGAAGMVG